MRFTEIEIGPNGKMLVDISKIDCVLLQIKTEGGEFKVTHYEVTICLDGTGPIMILSTENRAAAKHKYQDIKTRLSDR